MQSWISVFGKTALIASGKPLSPSTHAMSMSCTPRFLSSVKTVSQKLAPSASLTHGPSKSFLPLISSDRHVYAALFVTFPSLVTL